MRTARSLLFSLMVPLLAPAPDALATGLGLYFEYGNVFDGKLDHTIAGDVDFDEDHFGGGFSVDTNVAQDRLFHYRLDVGYQHTDGSYGPFGSLNGDGLVLHNAFGFGIVRNEHVRVWLGPAVRLSFDFFDDVPVFDDVFKFGVGLGPELGVNLHTGDLVSIGLSGGYQFRYVLAVPDGPYSNEDGYEHMAFLRMHVLFRLTGDRFAERPRPFRPGDAAAVPAPVFESAVQPAGEGEGGAPAGRVRPASSAPVDPQPPTRPERQSEDDAYNMKIWSDQQRYPK